VKVILLAAAAGAGFAVGNDDTRRRLAAAVRHARTSGPAQAVEATITQRTERVIDTVERSTMGIDKLKNAAKDAAGQAKESVGKTTGDRSLEDSGRKDQKKAKLAKAGDKVSDAARDAAKAAKE
jgi:uncharacterized protein YjbJ (UPF0337 family)